MTIMKGLRVLSITSMCLLSVLIIFLVGVPAYLGVYKGYALYNVTTSSMEPTIPVGSLVAVDTSSEVKPHVGDIVTFKPYSTAPMTITHRLVGETAKADGRYMVTQGDANEKADSPVPYVGLIGVVKHHVPYLGEWYEKRVSGSFVVLGGYVVSFIIYTVTTYLINKKKEV